MHYVTRFRTRIKAIVWDGSGLWVCAKRLERGRFQWPAAGEGERQITMRPEQLTLLLNGMDLTKVSLRGSWYRRYS